MPTYDYACDNCGHTFEAFQRMTDDALVTCPSCNEDSLRRLITGGTGVIFRGSGFYVNDSRGTTKSATAPAKESGSETTSATKDTSTETAKESAPKKSSPKEGKASEKKPA